MSDTYVMMDNMREYLGTFPSPRTHAHFLGRRYIAEDAKSFYGGILLLFLLSYRSPGCAVLLVLNCRGQRHDAEPARATRPGQGRGRRRRGQHLPTT
jgi:hypothetical protein